MDYCSIWLTSQEFDSSTSVSSPFPFLDSHTVSHSAFPFLFTGMLFFLLHSTFLHSYTSSPLCSSQILLFFFLLFVLSGLGFCCCCFCFVFVCLEKDKWRIWYILILLPFYLFLGTIILAFCVVKSHRTH